VYELVELIVTGRIEEGALLPPEGQLCEHFGVSRTVLRESMKRLEEKGLVVVTQGRGTQVSRSGSWNMLDHVVLSVLIDNDDSMGVLDELTVVRGKLESSMAATVAERRTSAELVRVERALDTMREAHHDSDASRQADAVFHFTVIEVSRNRLAGNIAKQLYQKALHSSRYVGLAHARAFETSLEEHALVVEAIAARDVVGAEEAMWNHIVNSWERRRLPAARGRSRH
jgi:DNA-binding FadR family transcriptional regulator